MKTPDAVDKKYPRYTIFRVTPCTDEERGYGVQKPEDGSRPAVAATSERVAYTTWYTRPFPCNLNVSLSTRKLVRYLSRYSLISASDILSKVEQPCAVQQSVLPDSWINSSRLTRIQFQIFPVD